MSWNWLWSMFHHACYQWASVLVLNSHNDEQEVDEDGEQRDGEEGEYGEYENNLIPPQKLPDDS